MDGYHNLIPIEWSYEAYSGQGIYSSVKKKIVTKLYCTKCGNAFKYYELQKEKPFDITKPRCRALPVKTTSIKSPLSEPSD